jgi:hypothetical protein
MVSSRTKFGTPIHTASTSPEISIASSDGKGRHGPSSSALAVAAIASRLAAVGL